MNQGLPGNKPSSLRSTFTPYFDILWRFAFSIALLGLALMIAH